MAEKTLIARAAVAERLGLTESQIKRLVNTRQIPFVRVGAQTIRFDPDEIDKWNATRKRLVDHETVAQRLGTNVRHVRQMVTDDKIPFVRLSPQNTYFDLDAIEDWIEAKKTEPVL